MKAKLTDMKMKIFRESGSFKIWLRALPSPSPILTNEKKDRNIHSASLVPVNGKCEAMMEEGSEVGSKSSSSLVLLNMK